MVSRPTPPSSSLGGAFLRGGLTSRKPARTTMESANRYALNHRAGVNLTRVTGYLDGQDFGRSVTYSVVASGAQEAANLMTDYLSPRHPWSQIEIDVLAGGRAEGPGRALGPV